MCSFERLVWWSDRASVNFMYSYGEHAGLLQCNIYFFTFEDVILIY